MVEYMLKNLGRLIWRQPREMNVLNYSNHIVFEIYTNNGYLYCIQEKASGNVEFTKKMWDSDRNEALPCLWSGKGGQDVLQAKRLH